MSSASAPARPILAPASPRIGRGALYAATMLVLVPNAMAAKAIYAVGQQGLAAALVNGLGMSWAFWFALAAALRLALVEAWQPLRARDLWLAGACLAAAMLPSSQLAALGCSLLAAAILLDRDDGPCLKASAWVLGAISVQLLWSRMLMLFFTRPIASLDAWLVSLIIRRPVHGTNVAFVDGSHEMSILAACTSVENASVALVLFVAVARSFRPVPQRSEALALAGAFASVVVVNLARLSLMGQNMAMYHLMHEGAGAAVTNAVITAIGLAWAVGSVRREIFR